MNADNNMESEIGLTIVAAYKQGNSVSIVSDFRVSVRENQADSILKYFQFGDRMGFFMAGSVKAWESIAQTIHSIADQITLENVISIDGPLYLSLRTLMETSYYNPDDGIPRIAGIGVYWHPTQPVYFELRGEMGSGIILSPMTDGITVIGNGSVIPGIHDLLARAVHRCILFEPEHHPLDVAEVIRKNLRGIMNRCGSSSYQKLGISPVFCIAWMNETGFCMEGEEFMSHSSTNEQGRYHYSFERVNGHVVLDNHQTQETVPLVDILTYSDSEKATEKFDPENRTTGFDAPAYISDNNAIYILLESLSDSMIRRTVFRTYAHRLVNGSVLADPRYERICEVVRRDPANHVLESFRNAPRFGNYGLIVPYNKQASFEAGIAIMAMDHTWMSEHVENYADMYTQSE
ncbi:hypothetical protein [Brevibacillus reuszeri]|uniref:hypothetical protein n=1 Tax=Brevibacillus reuszeri TaxID=54915 RepID=UPI0013E036F6|nr:hypothetical protein [Brevibacillus reuszeri]